MDLPVSAAMNNPEPRALIVTGMHRSGTSLAASLLESAGLHVGERLLGPKPSNPRGHFENLDFVEFHERLLRARGLDERGWGIYRSLSFDESAADEARRLVRTNAVSPAWGWKDPRAVLFLEAWAAVLDDAAFFFVHRAPWDVADSLSRQAESYGRIFVDDPHFAIDAWIHYNNEILSFHDQHPDRCLLVSIHTLTRDPSAAVRSLNRKFGLALTEPDRARFEDPLLRRPAEDDAGFRWLRENRPDAVELYRAVLERSLDPATVTDAAWIADRPSHAAKRWFRAWLDMRLAESRAALASAEAESARAIARRNQTDLEQTLRNADRERTRLQSELTKAYAQVAENQTSLAETLRNADSERTRLQSELTKAYAQLSAAQASLEETLRNADHERTRLQSELDEALRSAETERTRILSETRDEVSRAEQALDEGLREASVERSRLRSELAALESESEQRRAEAQILRAELKRSQYYLDETMNNAVGDRARLDAELAAARTYIDLFEREGIRNTLQRLRQKIRDKQKKLIRHYTPWLESAISLGRNQSGSRAAVTGGQASGRLSVDEFWRNVGPTLDRNRALTAEPVRISVLTPTWETGLAWFADTVKSVVGQSTTAWEWCIVDDGSTDADLRRVLGELAERVPRIRVSFEPRQGISAATNRALAMASGEIVCFLDHDDVLEPTALEETLDKMSGPFDLVYS
ncbi:MAG: glycosyltransferase, partial [Candidatus Binatia bacterium]